MNWDYKLAHQSVKNVKRFPAKDRKRIFDALEEMRRDPFCGDVKPMQGEETLWRRRVGSYRIYFRPQYKEYLLEIPEIVRKQGR